MSSKSITIIINVRAKDAKDDFKYSFGEYTYLYSLVFFMENFFFKIFMSGHKKKMMWNAQKKDLEKSPGKI